MNCEYNKLTTQELYQLLASRTGRYTELLVENTSKEKRELRIQLQHIMVKIQERRKHPTMEQSHG